MRKISKRMATSAQASSSNQHISSFREKALIKKSTTAHTSTESTSSPGTTTQSTWTSCCVGTKKAMQITFSEQRLACSICLFQLRSPEQPGACLCLEALMYVVRSIINKAQGLHLIKTPEFFLEKRISPPTQQRRGSALFQ